MGIKMAMIEAPIKRGLIKMEQIVESIPLKKKTFARAKKGDGVPIQARREQSNGTRQSVEE